MEPNENFRTLYMVFYMEYYRGGKRYMIRRKYFHDIAKANKFALKNVGKVVCVNFNPETGIVL